MKQIYGILIAAALVAPTVMTSSAIDIDGIADAAYGPPLAIQEVGTSFGDNTVGTYTNANGSELDAAYGFISNSVLYLVFAGNLEANFNKLEIFIDSIAGHGQNTLTNNNSGVDFGGLNRMGGASGTNGPGLTFEPDFAPDYWIGTTVGGSPVSFYANYAVLLDNGGGPGFFLGTANPTNSTLSGGTNPFGVKATINNINTNGVDGQICITNLSMVAQSNAAATVVTGMELSIPLSAVSSGALSTVKVCAFINGTGHDFVSNQILGPIATNDCIDSLGEPRNINFGNLPGVQYFIVPVVGCNFAINPQNALYPFSGGTGSVAMTTDFGCTWAATSNVPWITITSGTSGSGNGTVNYAVATNTTSVGRSGTMTIGGQTFTVNQYGLPLAVTIDGSVETNHYGCAPLVAQTIGVASFGDNIDTNVDTANGSELDGGFGVIENGVLYLVLSGNLASDFTKLEIFFETGPGGQNTLTNVNPDVDFNGLNRMGPNGNGAYTNSPSPGLTFDADFAPNYWIGVTCGGAPFSVFANYAQLWPGGGGSNGFYLGSTVGSTNGTLFGGTNPFGIQAAINNANIAGVVADGCFDDPSLFLQESVRTGIELGIPLAAIGSPTGAVKICAFVNGQGHDFVENQVLGPIWDGTGLFCQPTLGEPSLVNFSALPGQHYFVVGPEMRVTGITRAGSNINVSWLTAANSNLVYQLQRTSTFTTSVWSSVGSPTNGTGGVITFTDTGASTNTAYFYRVTQTPVCP
jgi:hypothetical protein